MKSLFILDRQLNVIGFMKNGGATLNVPPYFDDLLTEDLSTGAKSFQFTTILDEKGIASNLIAGNYIAFQRDEGYELFQIMQTEENHEEAVYITVYCECAGLELLNSVIRKQSLSSATYEKFIQTVLQDTSWEIGVLPVNVNSLDIEIEDNSVYNELQKNAKLYDVELAFRVEIQGSKVTSKYVDSFERRGNITGKRFEFGKDIEGIQRKTDLTNVYTALIGVGKDDISFKDITVDGINKPLGQDFVINEETYKRYNVNGNHIMGIYKYDTDSPEELLRQTYKYLNEECNEPKIEYNVDVALLGNLLDREWDKVRIGDMVCIVDNYFIPPIQVMARVSKLETSMTNPQNDKCTFSNFIEVQSNINESMRELASQLEGYVDSQFPIGTNQIQDGAVTQDKIDEKYSVKIVADSVEASLVEAEKLVADKATIKDLEAIKIQVDDLDATKANIGDLNAANANIGNLQADVGEINTLLAGNISSGNIQTGGITGDNLNMDTIFVKDANIIDINANKINAGTVNTNLVNIKSDSGNLIMKDNTIQIKDNARVRVQIGKDSTNDYSMSVWDSQGNLMFDARGLTADAIKSEIIRNDMVAENANISGSKLDIDSVISEVNENGTVTLQSSKIKLDTLGQTLDVAFNQLKSQADDTKSKTESNTTQLGIEQGRINTLIQDTTIVKDGQNLKLKDEYSKLEQTVNGLSSTVGSHTTEMQKISGRVDGLEGDMTTVENNYSTLNQDLSGFKTTVGNTYSTKSELSSVDGKVNSLTTKVENNTSSISQLSDSIALKVEKTYVDNAIDSVNNSISSVNNNVSSLTQTVGDITGKVESVEITTTKLDNQFTQNKQNIRCNELGIKINYSNFNTAKNGYLYLHGYDENGNPADVDGKIYWNNNAQIITKKAIPSSASYSTDCYLCVAVGSNKVFIAYRTSDKWKKFVVGSIVTSDLDLGDMNIAFGQFKLSSSGGNVEYAYLYSSPMKLENAIGISNIESRLSSAELKITDDSITSVVEKNFYTKQETEDAITSKGYQTSSQVQQTVDALEIKFEQSGGYNLLRNSAGLQNTNQWNDWNATSFVTSTDDSTRNHTSSKKTFVVGNNSSIEKYVASPRIKVQPNKTYTISGKYYVGVNCKGIDVYWLESDTIDSEGFATDVSYNTDRILVTDSNYSNGVWKSFSKTITTSSSAKSAYIRLDNNGSKTTSESYAYFSDLTVVEGELPLEWSPHPSEVYDGITTIDRDGVTVTSSNVNSKTSMSANGFRITKTSNNQDVFKVNNNGDLVLAGSITSGASITGGVLKSINGDLYFDLNNGYINIYNGGTKIGQTQKNKITGTGIYGISNGCEYGSYSCLSAKTSSSASTYSVMVTASGVDLTDKIKKGVNIGQVLNSNNWDFNLGSSTYLRWRQNGAIYDSFITEGSEGMLRMYGDNGAYIGYRNGDKNTYIIAIREGGNHTYPKSLSVFNEDTPATDNNGYSLEINAPIKMNGQSINECSNIKTLGLEIVDPVAFYSDSDAQTRTYSVTKNSQNIIEFIGSTEIINGESIIALPENVVFKNYVVILSPIGLNRNVSLIEKNDDNFKIAGDDGVVDYVIKFESVNYTSYMAKSINVDNIDTIERSEYDKPKELIGEIE